MRNMDCRVVGCLRCVRCYKMIQSSSHLLYFYCRQYPASQSGCDLWALNNTPSAPEEILQCWWLMQLRLIDTHLQIMQGIALEIHDTVTIAYKHTCIILHSVTLSNFLRLISNYYHRHQDFSPNQFLFSQHLFCIFFHLGGILKLFLLQMVGKQTLNIFCSICHSPSWEGPWPNGRNYLLWIVPPVMACRLQIPNLYRIVVWKLQRHKLKYNIKYKIYDVMSWHFMFNIFNSPCNMSSIIPENNWHKLFTINKNAFISELNLVKWWASKEEI